MKRTLSMTINRRAWSRVAVGWATLSLLAVAQGSLAAPQALAAVAPSAATGVAQHLQFASATVTGLITPNASPTTYFFQYGPTASYGRQTSAASAGSGTGPVAVSQSLSGLSAATTYHYRVVALSAGGTVDGKDATFATTKTPTPTKTPAPTATTGPASAVTTTTAVISATVNPNAVPTTYYFQYGPTSSYGLHTSAASAGSGTGPAAVSQSLGGLSAGKTYHYRVVAVSAGGTVNGKDAKFATTRTPAPTLTTGPASAVTTTTAVITGTVNPGRIATSYYFLYGTRSLSTRSPVTSAGAGTADVAVSAALSGLAPGTLYAYRLVAVGASTATGRTRSFKTAKIPARLSLASAANPVLAGAPVTFSGALSGTGLGRRAVALQIDRYPYTAGFQRVGSAQLTSASGSFSFTLPTLTANTMVRAVTVGGSPSLVSPVILEKAIVRVSVHVRRHGRSARFSGLIAPAGAPVQIRIQRRIRGRWVTVARTTTHPVSAGHAAYARTIARPHHGRYRVIAHMRNGSLLSAASRPVTVH